MSDSIDAPPNNIQMEVYGRNKIIIEEYHEQILTALAHFPELATTRIEIRLRPSNVLFSAKPTFGGMFRRAEKRSYVITISDSSQSVLVPLQLKNLPYDAQVGVLGHELSHISFFSGKSFFGLTAIAIRNMFWRQRDKFEYGTDRLCLEHGLCSQLLAWSSYIRVTMNRENWTGSASINKGPMLREKYMNPSTIKAHMLCK